MLKKILKKLGFIKDKGDEKHTDKNQEQNNDLNQNTKKEKDNSNTPDDIYPLW